MNTDLFASELWTPALDKYAEATGLTVELFASDGEMVLQSEHCAPLVALFREFGFEPGLFAECGRRCMKQVGAGPAVVVDESHGLSVVGTSLVRDGAIVGAAVAGYALARFSQIAATQRWSKASGVPFDRLWSQLRGLAPMPERRLLLHGNLLRVLGDALLRENLRTRQYQEAVAKLEAAAAAKDEFLSVLSHELRTPLAPIAGWASVLKRNPSPEQLRRGAEVIERNAFLQSRMIDDLLDMSRIVRGDVKLELEIVDLRSAVHAALEAFAPDVEKKSIRLELDEPGEALAVEADAVRLQQVFRNLVSNAVKFTPRDGEVRVYLGCESDGALVRMTDTGKGIEPEFLPFAFEIFRQQESGTRRAREGLGIGLSLVKKLTELHGGTVSIASLGPGRGTEVCLRLPLAAAAPAREAAKPAVASLAGISVLVVEDMEDARESLRVLLEILGASVEVACDGREALDMLLHRALPDVVLCDLLMPRMDGFELVREMDCGALPAHPPIIAMSGLANEASRARTRDAGFAGQVKKPFDSRTIVSAVAAALAERQTLRASPG